MSGSGSRFGISWLIATIAYMVGLMLPPAYGLTAAPVLVAVVVLASRIEARDAALLGFLAGLAGYVLLLGVAGGVAGVRVLAGIGGPITVLVAFSYHLIVPAALSYLAASLRG
ncbi:MAG: hypothetical protein GSR73_06625 [Desulfurococcales archaeon]|nr:hypothetical protein [Desulfurococcales archaeon]